LKDYISQDYDNLQGSLADYCADNGYTPENYFVVVKGTAQADHDSGGCLSDDPDGKSLLSFFNLSAFILQTKL